MATEPERVVLTYDDYAQIPPDRNRYELFDGEIAVTPAPSLAHQRTVLNLGALLRNHVRKGQLGEVFVAPCDVLLGETTVVQPDVLFVSVARSAMLSDPRFVKGAPDLVVEVVSPRTGQQDRHVKRQLYARYGVPNYWIFDHERREARALVLEAHACREVVVATGDQMFAAPPFSDLPIALAEIWG